MIEELHVSRRVVVRCTPTQHVDGISTGRFEIVSDCLVRQAPNGEQGRHLVVCIKIVSHIVVIIVHFDNDMTCYLSKRGIRRDFIRVKAVGILILVLSHFCQVVLHGLHPCLGGCDLPRIVPPAIINTSKSL